MIGKVPNMGLAFQSRLVSVSPASAVALPVIRWLNPPTSSKSTAPAQKILNRENGEGERASEQTT
jgi:hypothetical protein